MSRFELLVGSAEFWHRLQRDIGRASRRVLIQAMTFEGDETGKAAASAVEASRAQDRRILVDRFTDYFVSDRFVYGPARLGRAFRREVEDTRAMFDRLAAVGVGVRSTNPVGFLLHRFPNRNHKKLMITDGVAYLGGINFSDHNYAWHDLMVRIDDCDIADALAQDFDATWRGSSPSRIESYDDITLYFLDGRNNGGVFAELMQRVRRARRSIRVISPYLTFPFCEELRDVVREGVQVTLFTPDANNKRTVRDYLMWEAGRSGYEVRLYHAMSHLKAMLIDGEALVVGSSNFDFVSYHSQEELVAVIEDPELVREFNDRVLDKDLGSTRPMRGSDISSLRGALSFGVLKIAAGLCRVNRRAARGAR